jgi:hypothetical protein
LPRLAFPRRVLAVLPLVQREPAAHRPQTGRTVPMAGAVEAELVTMLGLAVLAVLAVSLEAAEAEVAPGLLAEGRVVLVVPVVLLSNGARLFPAV